MEASILMEAVDWLKQQSVLINTMSLIDGIWAVSVNFKVVIAAIVLMTGQTNEKKPITSNPEPLF